MHHSTSHHRLLYVICAYFRQQLLGSLTGLDVNHTAADFLGEVSTGHAKILLVLKKGNVTIML